MQPDAVERGRRRLPLRVDDLAGPVASGPEARAKRRDAHVVDPRVDERQGGGPYTVRSAGVRHVAVLLAPGWVERSVHREKEVVPGARIHLQDAPFVVRQIEVRSGDTDFPSGRVALGDAVPAQSAYTVSGD